MFDSVSCQFAMHYAFDSESSVKMLLNNVSKFLKPGGTFIGTIIDANVLVSALNECDDDNMQFGNSLFTVTFDQRPEQYNFYGQKYHFHLKDAVDAPEFLVHFEAFEESVNIYFQI